jgi:hypothetical protein
MDDFQNSAAIVDRAVLLCRHGDSEVIRALAAVRSSAKAQPLARREVCGASANDRPLPQWTKLARLGTASSRSCSAMALEN